MLQTCERTFSITSNGFKPSVTTSLRSRPCPAFKGRWAIRRRNSDPLCWGHRDHHLNRRRAGCYRRPLTMLPNRFYMTYTTPNLFCNAPPPTTTKKSKCESLKSEGFVRSKHLPLRNFGTLEIRNLGFPLELVDLTDPTKSPETELGRQHRQNARTKWETLLIKKFKVVLY